MQITGIYLFVKTGPESWARTDDALYLGIVGTVGGREFHLDTPSLEAGTQKTFKWGEASFRADVVNPSLGGTVICRPNVTHVYLRKHGGATRGIDNAWNMAEAFVFIEAEGLGTTDVYVTTGPEKLSFETGQIVYMAQSAHLGEYFDKRIPVTGAAECSRADAQARAATIKRVLTLESDPEGTSDSVK